MENFQSRAISRHLLNISYVHLDIEAFYIYHQYYHSPPKQPRQGWHDQHYLHHQKTNCVTSSFNRSNDMVLHLHHLYSTCVRVRPSWFNLRPHFSKNLWKPEPRWPGKSIITYSWFCSVSSLLIVIEQGNQNKRAAWSGI